MDSRREAVARRAVGEHSHDTHLASESLPPPNTLRENRALFHGPSVAVVAIALAVPAANSARKRPGFFYGEVGGSCLVTIATRFLLISFTKRRLVLTQHSPQRMIVRRRPVTMSTIAPR